MKKCKRCLYTESHPLTIVIDDNGLCSGCKIHEEKDSIDWQERGERLKDIFKEFKSKSGNNYDCVIPVSGGRDSFFIVDIVKNIYGMNPLLVSYNKQYNTDTGIRNLAQLRMKFDCDFMMLTVNPEKIKKITRATLRRFGSIYWHCIAGQTVYPVQVATKYKIPLIVWGAHQGVDQVGMYSHFNEVEMTRRYRKEHDLMGFEAEDLIDWEFDNIREADVFEYFYPDDKLIEYVGVRGIYLNNYIRWDTKTQHELMIKKFKYETRTQTRTFDIYNDVDCYNYSDLHDYIKFLKHGYGKVVDHVCREIRFNRLTRDQGVELARHYLSIPPKYSHLFFDWLGITEKSFNYIINQHRNPNIWYRDDEWSWKMIDTELVSTENSNLDEKDIIRFRNTRTGKSGDTRKQYIIFGKGFEG